MTGSINLYVNDQLTKRIPLTSRYMWNYSLVGYWYNPYQNTPQAGLPHFPYDEVQVLLDQPIPEGAKVTLKLDDQDNLPWVVIDFIDIESVPEARLKPTGFLDLNSDCHAKPNDHQDDSAIFEQCVAQAKQQKTGVYIPIGQFDLDKPFTDSDAYQIADVPITGAGIWYSELNLKRALQCRTGACLVSHLRIRGDIIQRVYQWQALGFKEDNSVDGIQGFAFAASLIEDVWFEHVRSAWWARVGEGVTVKNVRVRNTFADGLNFYRNRNSTIINSTFRNTGDDAIAAWAHGQDDQGFDSENIQIHHNTIQLPRMMNCISLYGGKNLSVDHNLCIDVGAIGAGIMLSNMYDSLGFTAPIKIQNNTIIRGGSDNLGGMAGAITVQARSNTLLKSIELIQNQIIEPLYAGVTIGAGRGFSLEGKNATIDLSIDGLEVIRPGTFAVSIDNQQKGQMNLRNLQVMPANTVAVNNASPATYSVAYQK